MSQIFNQRRFANARLTRDRNNLPLAVESFV